jgi:hypothetical protein
MYFNCKKLGEMLGTYLNVRALAYCVQSLGSISDIIKKKGGGREWVYHMQKNFLTILNNHDDKSVNIDIFRLLYV